MNDLRTLPGVILFVIESNTLMVYNDDYLSETRKSGSGIRKPALLGW
jgi:hypothetical protein